MIVPEVLVEGGDPNGLPSPGALAAATRLLMREGWRDTQKVSCLTPTLSHGLSHGGGELIKNIRYHAGFRRSAPRGFESLSAHGAGPTDCRARLCVSPAITTRSVLSVRQSFGWLPTPCRAWNHTHAHTCGSVALARRPWLARSYPRRPDCPIPPPIPSLHQTRSRADPRLHLTAACLLPVPAFRQS
jgi:hypothetical protein